MSRRWVTLLGIGSCVLAAVLGPAAMLGAAEPDALVLAGGTLVDGTGGPSIPDALVVLRGGRIVCVGPRSACRVPAGAKAIDVSGTWITPGLVDAHVHYSQTGWADGRPDALDLRDLYPYEDVEARLRAHPERFHRSYLASGVTAVFDVGGYPWTAELQHRTEADTRAPHVIATGPLLSTRDFWLNLPGEKQFIYLANDSTAREGVRYLRSLGAAAVKVWFIMTPSRPFEEMSRTVAAAGEEARRFGLPLIVHATGLRQAKASLRAGARLLVHSVEDTLVDAEFLELARRNQVLYCPTLTVRAGYLRMYESALSGRPPQVDDPSGAVDSLTLARLASTGRVGAERVPANRVPTAAAREKARATMAANLAAVRQAGIKVVMGTDAGNPLTLHGPAVYAEMEAMQAAGMSPIDVLVASTRNGAEAMDRLADLGTIEVGKQADLLVVDADPTRDIANLRRIRFVVRGGVMRTPQEIAGWARQVADPAE